MLTAENKIEVADVERDATLIEESTKVREYFSQQEEVKPVRIEKKIPQPKKLKDKRDKTNVR